MTKNEKGLKPLDETKLPRPQTLYFEVLKELVVLNKKVDIIDEQLRILVRLSQGSAPVVGDEEYREADQKPVQVIDNLDVSDSLLGRLERTGDGGFKLKVGVNKEQFHTDNQEMWAAGFKYVPRKGWYRRE